MRRSAEIGNLHTGKGNYVHSMAFGFRFGKADSIALGMGQAKEPKR